MKRYIRIVALILSLCMLLGVFSGCNKVKKNDDYVTKSIMYLKSVKGMRVSYSDNAEIVIPKRKISFKSRLLHSRAVSSLGMALFPKGSKIRSALKRKL